MTTGMRDRPGMADEDRLPWLESADDDTAGRGTTGRIALIVVFSLLLIGGILWAVIAYRTPRPVDGAGELIAAPQGPYKVRPDEPGGMRVEGRGDTVFATSEGGRSEGRIDARAVPEAPVAGRIAAPAPPATGGTAQVVTEVPRTGGRLTVGSPRVALPPATGGGGGSALVQLGSFPSEGAANTAWTRQSTRFAYLAPLGRSVERAEVSGRTVYRLRVNAGSNGAARALCDRLRVAGEACFVPAA